MALSSNGNVRWRSVRPKLPRFNTNDLNKRKLIVDFQSLRPIARRAIKSLERRESYHPHKINYLFFINITILNDKLFQNLNLNYIFEKPRGVKSD